MPSRASAREPLPQRHEVNASLDIAIESKFSGGLANLGYTFFADPLDRLDDTHPALRRFIDHPNALWVQLRRESVTLEQTWSAEIGGALHLAGGLVGVSAQAGLKTSNVKQDPFEPGYNSAPMRFELTTYALPRTRIAATLVYQPILGATSEEAIITPSTRESGRGLEASGAVAGATCGDLLYGEVRGGWRDQLWTFSDAFAGDLAASGPFAQVHGALQITRSTQLALRGELESLDWTDTRSMDETRVMQPLDRRARRIQVDLDLVYWFRGGYGARVTVGGGYQERRPIVFDESNGFGRFGFGVMTRF
jgi:hypothetical protein